MTKIKNNSQEQRSIPIEPLERLKLDAKTAAVFSRSRLKYETPQMVEHHWVQLNQNSKITSQERARQKIFSITAFCITQARLLNIDAQKIRDVYFCRYREPLTYLTALRNYIPELSDSLAFLANSEQVDNRFRLKIS